MSRVIGLDIGDRRIGVAVSDALGITAQGVTVLNRTSKKNDAVEISKIIDEYRSKTIVVGIPKNMNGTLGPQAEKTMDFAEYLKRRFKVEIIYQDERLTTVSAERILIEGNVRRENRKEYVDKVAATFILQSFLDRASNKANSQL